MSARCRSWMPALAGALMAACPLMVEAQVRNWPSEAPPKPLAARPSAFPAYEIRTLANGLRVVAVNHHEQPIVSAQLLVKAGSAYEPIEKGGLANLVALLLDQGTTTRTAQELADAIDTIGGELSVLSGRDVTFAQVTVMTDSFGFGLELLSDVVRYPAFDAAELDRQRQQLRSGLKVGYEDPDYLATLVFDRLVFGFHPYGLPGEGTAESISAIVRDDLVQFHQAYFAPNNAILAVVGDVSAEDAFAAAERAFGGWGRRPVTPPRLFDPPAPARRVVVIDKPGLVQTEIRVGHLGIARNNKDYLAADLGVRVLGGEGGNRLQQVLRTARGLTYGASANLDTYRLSGIVRAETDTRVDATAEALRVSVDEFFKLQRESIGSEELEAAKAYLVGSFPLGLETPGSISTKVLNAMFHELPLEELETYRERVTAITPAEVQAAMRNYLRPERLSMVIVGYAAAFLPALRGVGIKDPEVIRADELDLLAVSLRRASAAGEASPPGPGGMALTHLASDAEWAAARLVVERAVTAAGGEAALRGVKTLSAMADTALVTPAGPLRARTKTLLAYPDRMRVDAQTSAGDLVQAYANGRAWIWDKRGPREAPDALRAEFALGVRRDWIALLLAALDNRLTGRRAAGDTGPGGRPLDVVELWGVDLPLTKVAFDQGTGRLERLSYQTRGRAGLETVTESFADFRLVGGVLYPFRAVTRRDDAPVLERTITELWLNPDLAASVFELPK